LGHTICYWFVKTKQLPTTLRFTGHATPLPMQVGGVPTEIRKEFSWLNPPPEGKYVGFTALSVDFRKPRFVRPAKLAKGAVQIMKFGFLVSHCWRNMKIVYDQISSSFHFIIIIIIIIL